MMYWGCGVQRPGLSQHCLCLRDLLSLEESQQKSLLAPQGMQTISPPMLLVSARCQQFVKCGLKAPEWQLKRKELLGRGVQAPTKNTL